MRVKLHVERRRLVKDGVVIEWRSEMKFYASETDVQDCDNMTEYTQ